MNHKNRNNKKIIKHMIDILVWIIALQKKSNKMLLFFKTKSYFFNQFS